MAVSKSDIKFYLTTVEPDIAQTNTMQSIGGYISTSVVHPSTTLAADISLSGDDLKLSAFTDLENLNYVHANSEIIETKTITATDVGIEKRAVNESRNYHATSDIIYGLSVDSMFNQKFNDDRKQYRCIAVKNEHATDSAINTGIYIKKNVINDSSVIKIAVEMPVSDYRSGSSTSGSKMTVVDSSIATTFDDNHFKDALLRMTSGLNANQARVVSSYDGATGTFVLDSSLPFNVPTGDNYEVEPAPAQRVSSGFIQPSFGTTNVTALSKAIPSSFIDIDVSGSRDNGSDLKSKDVMYIWLERSLIKDSSEFSFNSTVLAVNYFTA